MWLLLLLVSCGACLAAGDTGLTVAFASDFPPFAKSELLSLLAPFEPTEVPPATNVTSGSLFLVFGGRDRADCGFALGTAAEAFQVTRRSTAGSAVMLCCDGNPSAMATHSGRVFASFALLTQLGFGFFHPQRPLAPVRLSLSARFVSDKLEKPFWPIRGSHYHSEHPLDLTELLFGVDSVDKTWEEMLPEWSRYLGWLASHKVNRVEFVVLCPSDELPRCQDANRTARYRTLVEYAHSFGIALFADISFALKQQHAMRMIYSKDLPLQRREIRATTDWALAACGFDSISTEAGTSEFTATDCAISLQWYNELANYITETYPGKKAYIKMHVSLGQVCAGFASPIAPVGAPINFNFLPVFANLSMGVMPHTVQMYTMEDPTSNTYGNKNFSDILEIGMYAASQGRETVFFGENTYWINYDIDIPLNLGPVYAWRAVADLRNVARRQDPQKPFSGSFLFESGWEFGYIWGAIANYEASWDPRMSLPDTQSALIDIMSFMDDHFGPGWAKAFATVAETMRQPLIYGVGGPTDLLNGMAYLQGWDTWSELFTAIGFGQTEPNKVQFLEMRTLPFLGPQFSKILSVLNATAVAAENCLNLLSVQMHLTDSSSSPFIRELVDTANITYQRAVQVMNLALVAHRAADRTGPEWQIAESALYAAIELIGERMRHINVARIASWRPNPTSYKFTYLWTAKSMFFFWRDRQQLYNNSFWSPCLMNVQDPIDVAFGEGMLDDAMKVLRYIVDHYGVKEVGQCLAAPTSEPEYPRDAH